jgi:AcrR family transcriptional regulator
MVARPKLGTHKIPTDQRILVSAEKAFGKLGFERATLADIAAEAGIRRPSLLYHFESKDVLYRAVIRRVFDALKQELVETMKPAPFQEQVFNLTEAFRVFVVRRPAFAPLILRDIIDGQGPSHEILSKEIGPVLSLVEHWIFSEGRTLLPSDFPIRAALLQICSTIMLYAASGSLKHSLWKDNLASKALSEKIFSTIVKV